MVRGDEKDTVLDDPAIKLEGHLSDFAARVAVEHPRFPDRGHGACLWSLRERTGAHLKGQDGLPGWSPGQGRWWVYGTLCPSLNKRGSSLSFGHTSRHGRVARAGRTRVTLVQNFCAEQPNNGLELSGSCRAVLHKSFAAVVCPEK